MKKTKIENDEIDGLALNFVDFANRYKELYPEDDGKAINNKLAEAIGSYRRADVRSDILRTLSECIIVCFGLYNINPDLGKYTASILLHHASYRTDIGGIEVVVVTRWALYEAEKKYIDK